MDAVKRFAAVSLLLLGALAIGFAVSGVSRPGGSGAGAQNYTVSRLLEETPLDENVRVRATVSTVLGDYTSEAGNTYQQFRVTDGDAAVKVFCSTASGRANLSTGETVTVAGTFQEFYGTYEIYTRCSSVRAG